MQLFKNLKQYKNGLEVIIFMSYYIDIDKEQIKNKQNKIKGIILQTNKN